MSNLLGSVFSCYPITGSFSRSAVNNSVGAKSQLAGFITAILMLLTLLALTRYFFFLPLYCLAAIVISSVTNLVDIGEARYLWKVKRSDFLLWMVAFLGTLFLGVQARARPAPSIPIYYLEQLVLGLIEWDVKLWGSMRTPMSTPPGCGPHATIARTSWPNR
jgi:hypothetical protein